MSLGDDLFQTDECDANPIFLLLLHPLEDMTTVKEGYIGQGHLKSVIAQTSWSHISPTMPQKTTLVAVHTLPINITEGGFNPRP